MVFLTFHCCLVGPSCDRLAEPYNGYCTNTVGTECTLLGILKLFQTCKEYSSGCHLHVVCCGAVQVIVA